MIARPATETQGARRCGRAAPNNERPPERRGPAYLILLSLSSRLEWGILRAELESRRRACWTQTARGGVSGWRGERVPRRPQRKGRTAKRVPTTTITQRPRNAKPRSEAHGGMGGARTTGVIATTGPAGAFLVIEQTKRAVAEIGHCPSPPQPSVLTSS